MNYREVLSLLNMILKALKEKLKQIENKLCNLKHGCMYDGMYLFVLSCIDDIL